MNKTSNRKTRVIAIVCASVLALSSAFVFAGCKGSKDAAPTTAAATVAAKATEAKKQAAQGSNNDAQIQNDNNNNNDQQGVSSQAQDDSSSSHSINEAWFAGISEQQAGFNALDASDPNGRITYTEQGTYNGQDCWIIYVKGADNMQYDVYVSGDFCVVDSDTTGHGINDAYFAGISEQAAGQAALQAVGSEGWRISGYFQSSYNGADAWEVTVENENGETQTVFVNGDGVYF